MPSPFEEVSASIDHDQTLPEDNWLANRIATARSHEQSVVAVVDTIGKMGAMVLEGRIATFLETEGSSDLEGTSPSQPVGEATFSIVPAFRQRRWSRYGSWTPDTAMELRLTLSDTYDYSDRSGGPKPLGLVDLALYARTWGKLTDEEIAGIKSVNGAYTDYSDLGFNCRGTSVHLTRAAGQLLSEREVETALAPLSRHVVNYFDIVHEPVPDPSHSVVQRDLFSRAPGTMTERPRRHRSRRNSQEVELTADGLHYLVLPR